MEQQVNKLDELTQKPKNVWVIVVTIIVTAIVVGGGIYWWQKSVAKNEKQKAIETTTKELQQQINNLQRQITQLKTETNQGLAATPATQPRAIIQYPSITPETVVKNFYDWYINYPGNLLSSGKYKTSQYLSNELVQKIEGILSSFGNGPGYDPIVCAQDIPNSITPNKAIISDKDASVIVHSSFINHSFKVKLKLKNGQWKITDIICSK